MMLYFNAILKILKKHTCSMIQVGSVWELMKAIIRRMTIPISVCP